MPDATNAAKVDRETARQLLRQYSVQVGGPFRLASGKTSDFYVDVKRTALRAEGLAALGRLILMEAERWPKAEAIGGPELGAVPLVAAAVTLSAAGPRPLRGFMIRKAAKEHGTAQQIEGLHGYDPSTPLIVVEDVVTSGGSALRAATVLRDNGYTLAGAICIVDRQEGGAEAFAAAGIELVSLFRKSEFMR